MRQSCYFVLLTLLAICQPSVAASAAVADEPRLEENWFARPWKIHYEATVTLPDEPKLKSNGGTEFSQCVLLFDAEARFVAEKDRTVAHLGKAPDWKVEFVEAKGGQVAFEERRGQFLHHARWKTADGTARDYAFGGSGLLRGNGQFTADALELHLEWTTGEGRGTSDGRRILEPVAVHAWKSDWTLKPESPGKSNLAGVAAPKLILAGTRTTKMPQKLADCPPLPLVERVSLVPAPTTDLQLKVKKLDKPASGRGRYVLTVSLENLGPDASGPLRLGIVLPDGATHGLAGENVVAHRRHLVSLLLPALEAGRSSEVEIPFALEASPDVLAQGGYLVLVEVKNPAHDPNAANNGVLHQLSVK